MSKQRVELPGRKRRRPCVSGWLADRQSPLLLRRRLGRGAASAAAAACSQTLLCSSRSAKRTDRSPTNPGRNPGGSTAGRANHAAALFVAGMSPFGEFSMSFKKETPLANAAFWAARKGNLALLQLLLNSGRVDVDCKDSLGSTALMVAAYYGHKECVRELVLQGADINLQRETGATALFFAAQQGHNEIVKLLFEFGASTEFKTKDGGTALLAACQYGHMRVVETLLKHGANIHDQLYDGATALFLAAQGGYLDLIRLLLSSGAKVNQPRQDGTAPLWIASQMGHSEVVRVMLLRGADRDAARSDGTTALLKAANKGYNEVIEELLKFSPALGLLKNGTSALHAAVLGGNIGAVALLLEAGADPFLKNKKNELPSDLTKNERILRLLQSRAKYKKS